MKQKYFLFIAFSLLFLKGTAQSNYAVSAIPFQPFSGTLTSLTTADDLYSPVINLPFSFDFYGTSYNQIVISTNGYIDFRTTYANQISPWNFNQPIPNVASFPVKNSILGCYEDLFNSNATGSLTYGSYGTAPNRKFVVYFNNQPHFNCGNTALSSFQMILSEASNTIDVQLINRQACTGWNSGSGVIGLVNLDGTQAIVPPGRNTGSWNASQEAWRFYRPGYYTSYSFVRCDANTDGFQVFDLTVADNDLGGNYTFYETLTDAQTNNFVAAIANLSAYVNISPFQQTLYAVGAGGIKTVTLSVIDCTIDADSDSVPNADEDTNADTNLANDDTDFDGLPNYLDNDDDGDLILTNVEYVFSKNATSILDTDNDGIPNYLDKDDDGDGTLTFLEDYNHDGNPTNDDTNTNGTPDYLDMAVTSLGVSTNSAITNSINVYPNPASDVLHVQNNSTNTISLIEVYSINGSKIKSVKASESITTLSVTDLQSGVYFVKVITDNGSSNYKFIKK